MMKKRENEYENSGLSVDNDVSQFWCRVIEGIIQDTVQKTIRSMQVEQYAEVDITDVNVANNTVTCRNIQTGEEFNNVPNYSNVYVTDVITNKDDILIGVTTSTGEQRMCLRGRMFIANIKDNPYYLGVWYDEQEVK